MLILSGAEVWRALPMQNAIESQRWAFSALAAKQVDLPLRTPLQLPDQQAVVYFMPAQVAGNLGAKIVSVFPHNRSRRLATVHGLLILIDASTGCPLALMDATTLTALRTGAASGLATDLLARADARTAAIIGSGGQAATQLLAICAVRPIERVRVFSRDPAHVATFIGRLQPQVNAELLPAKTASEAVRAADVVCTATMSTAPVFDGHDLQPGAHVNGVGSFTTEMQEVDCVTVRRAGRVFVDAYASALAEAGDVVIPLRNGVIAAADMVEIGAVVAGVVPVRARGDSDSITFFKSVGVAVQDLTAAGEVLRRARELGLGTEVDLS
jgi:ornithine cyclodeaminase/alanine dehydrogenase-like protein (mu-crystallin family)